MLALIKFIKPKCDKNIQTESFISHGSLKQFLVTNGNMATFFILRHPVNILVTAFTKNKCSFFSPEGSLVDIWAYETYTLVGPTFKGLVLDPLAAFTSTTIYIKGIHLNLILHFSEQQNLLRDDWFIKFKHFHVCLWSLISDCNQVSHRNINWTFLFIAFRWIGHGHLKQRTYSSVRSAV